ncbi:MAG: crossover junction endodeoxyribonuclease RuvC [Gemmatimonadota bacterium]
MKVLGIDPGTAILGYGLVEGGRGTASRLVECGVVRTAARSPLASRLQLIHQELVGLIERLGPDVLAVEGIFYGKNVRTTITLGHARGVILLAGQQAGLRIAEYAPRLVKSTVVGRGGAAKPQVGYMVAQLLRLTSAPRPADAADAVAIALTHILRGGVAERIRMIR